MLEGSEALVDLSSGSLGALLGLSWALLGPSWGPQGPLLGLSWGILEAIDQKRRELFFGSPLGARKLASRGPLGDPLGALGAVLGPSCAPLGALLDHIGAILRPQEPIGGEKSENAKNIDFL